MIYVKRRTAANRRALSFSVEVDQCSPGDFFDFSEAAENVLKMTIGRKRQKNNINSNLKNS